MRTRARIVSSCLDFKKPADFMIFTILSDDFVLFVRIRGDDSTELKVFCSSTQKKTADQREKAV